MGYSTLARVAAHAARGVQQLVRRPVTAHLPQRAATAAIFGQQRVPVRFYADDPAVDQAEDIKHQEVPSNMVNHAFNPKQVRDTCSWLAEFKPRYDATGHRLEQRPEDAEAAYDAKEVVSKVDTWKHIHDRKRELNQLIAPAIAFKKVPLNTMHIRQLNWLQRYKEEDQKLNALLKDVIDNMPDGKFKDKAFEKVGNRITQIRHHCDIESDRYIQLIKMQQMRYATFHDHEQVHAPRPLTLEPATDAYDGPHTNS